MIHDISMAISKDIQVYKNKEIKKPFFIDIANYSNGSVYETNMTFNLHTGTHIDFPLHIIEHGETSDSLELSDLIGEAIVIDLSKVQDGIHSCDFINYEIKENDFVLLKTKNSETDHFLFDYTYLAEDGASYLISKNIKGVGIDALGIERSQVGHPTHKVLLNNGLFIIEGLRLKGIIEGRYDFIILPLKISNVEALPARAILIDKA
ncbi:MAG: cyclase family protein [Candidatus Izemoplasmatales bacterium]|jgi:arylformamidase|nr:cyclase family protein [Candidatus Izemoplasmatales bacterium]